MALPQGQTKSASAWGRPVQVLTGGPIRRLSQQSTFSHRDTASKTMWNTWFFGATTTTAFNSGWARSAVTVIGVGVHAT